MYDESKYRSYTSSDKGHTTKATNSMLGFGVRDRIGDIVQNNNLSKDFIFKKLYQPEHTTQDPNDPKRLVYNYHDWDKIKSEQMARRMDRKVIKLEAAYGSERQFIVVKRNQDLIVRDVMEEVNRVFKIPMDVQVIFHKGTNLCDFIGETLENLGVENNHPIRICRDDELLKKSPRSKQSYMYGNNGNQNYNNLPPSQQQPQQFYDQQQQQQQQNRPLSPVSYLKEISPGRVPDPTPHTVRMYNQMNQANQANQEQFPRDVLKLYVTYGSDREYLLVHGRKPLMIYDLKLELNRAFKIPLEKQCIVFKGYYLHEYLDDAPLEAFGLENNSPISVWFKGDNEPTVDIRLPRPPSPRDMQQYSPRQNPNLITTPRWVGSEKPTEVLKIEVQHGSDRHQVILKGHDRNVLVQDLQNEIERMTAVPVKDQRLFYRSQELHLTPNKSLRECEVENNCVIKMVGDPSKIRYSNYFGRMNVKPGSQ